MLTQLNMKFILLISVKMPTKFGILTFVNMIIPGGLLNVPTSVDLSMNHFVSKYGNVKYFVSNLNYLKYSVQTSCCSIFSDPNKFKQSKLNDHSNYGQFHC